MNYGGSKHSNLRSASKTKRRNKIDVHNLKNTLSTLRSPLSPTFFGTMQLFLKPFELHQRVPPSFVSIFCNTVDVKKSQRVPPFTFFGTVTLLKNLNFKNFLGNFFKSSKGPPSFFFIFCNQLEFHKARRVPLFTILSLIYSADFGRSRLVIF